MNRAATFITETGVRTICCTAGSAEDVFGFHVFPPNCCVCDAQPVFTALPETAAVLFYCRTLHVFLLSELNHNAPFLTMVFGGGIVRRFAFYFHRMHPVIIGVSVTLHISYAR